MAGANPQPTPTDTTNTEPQSSLGLSLTAANTEVLLAHGGHRTTPCQHAEVTEGADGGEGAKQPLRGASIRRPPKPSTDSESSGGEQGACSGTSSIGSAVNADSHRGNVAQRSENSNQQATDEGCKRL